MPNIIEQHLNSIGFSLPKIIKTAGTYTPYILENNFSQIFISDSLEDRLHKMKKIIKPIKIINIDKGIINEE